MRFEENRKGIRNRLHLTLGRITTSSDAFRHLPSGDPTIALDLLREAVGQCCSLQELRSALSRSSSFARFLAECAITEDARRLAQEFLHVISELTHSSRPGVIGQYVPFEVGDEDLVTDDGLLRWPEWLSHIPGRCPQDERSHVRILNADRAIDAHDLVGDFVDVRTMAPFGAHSESLRLSEASGSEIHSWVSGRLPSRATPVILTSGFNEAALVGSTHFVDIWSCLLDVFANGWEDAVAFCPAGGWLLTHWHEGYIHYTPHPELDRASSNTSMQTDDASRRR